MTFSGFVREVSRVVADASSLVFVQNQKSWNTKRNLLTWTHPLRQHWSVEPSVAQIMTDSLT